MPAAAQQPTQNEQTRTLLGRLEMLAFAFHRLGTIDGERIARELEAFTALECGRLYSRFDPYEDRGRKRPGC